MHMNVEYQLDKLKMSSFHYRLITVAGLGTLFDSLDVGIVGFVMAALIKAWSLGNLMIGLVGSASLVGMAIGAMVSGALSDRLGRRQIFMMTLLIYSVATGLSGLSITLSMLLLFRFFVGVGLGGELPVTTTMVAEFLPQKSRGQGIVLLESFWAVGWLIASIVAFLVIPHYGWRIAFFIGMLPALYVLYLRRHIPESPRYLNRKGRFEEAKAAMAAAYGSAVANNLTANERTTTQRVYSLFGQGMTKKTLMLWVLWIGMNFAFYGMFLWLPSVLVEKGYSLVNSFGYVVIVTLVEIPGYLSAAWVVDRLGRKRTLIGYVLLSALAAGAFGTAHSVSQILLYGCLLSFFNLGAWGVTYVYTTEQYPTLIRGTGSGWAMGMGRIGGIVAPFLVGGMMASHVGISAIFLMFMIVLLVVAGVVAILGKETSGKSLEELEQSV